MPIIKADNDVNRFFHKIVRTPNGSISVPGQSNVLVRESITMQSSYWDCPVEVSCVSDGNDDFALMLCTIPQNATGLIMGFKTTGFDMYIDKPDSTQIVFHYGNGLSISQPYIQGRHLIGFANRKAYFDGNLSMSAFSHSAFSPAFHYRFGSAAGVTGKSPISNIAIHQVAVYAYHPATGAKCRFDYYPVTINGVCKFLDFRRTLSTPTITTNTGGSITASSECSYGISIADVKDVIGSPFNDVFCLLAGDNDDPLPAAYSADILSKDSGGETLSRKFAFALADSERSTSSIVPFPSDWTLASRPSSELDDLQLEKGDLIPGRRPFWHLWADHVNYGRFVQNALNNEGFELRYNIFHKPFNPSAASQGFNSSVSLEVFENYNNDFDIVHEPSFEVLNNGSIHLEIHNGIVCITDESNRVPQYYFGPGEHTYPPRYDWLYYKNNTGVSGKCNMAAGNLANFSYDLSDFSIAGTNEWHTGIAVGVFVKFRQDLREKCICVAYLYTYDEFNNGSSGTQLRPFSSWYPQNASLSEMTEASLIRIRDGVIEGSQNKIQHDFVFNCSSSLLPDLIDLLRQHPSGLQARAELCLISQASTSRPVPLQASLIRTSLVLPTQSVVLTNDAVTGYRCLMLNNSIVRTVNGVQKTIYIYPVRHNGGHPTRSADGHFGFYFILWSTSYNVPSPSDKQVSPQGLGDIFANIRMTRADSNGIVQNIKDFRPIIPHFWNVNSSIWHGPETPLGGYVYTPYDGKYFTNVDQYHENILCYEIFASDQSMVEFVGDSSGMPENTTVEISFS